MFGSKKSKVNSSPRQTRIPVQRSQNKEFFSYHTVSNRDRDKERDSSTNRQRPDNAATTERRFNVQHIPMIIAVICLVLSAIYITTLQTKVILRTEQKSTTLREESAYRDFADLYLSASVLNRSKLTFDSQKFEQAMTEEFPELSSASVSIPLIGHKPVVTLYTTQPVLLMGSEKGVFAISKSGRAIVKASAQQPIEGLNIPLVRDEANIPIELGKGALTSQDVTFITTLVTQFENKKIPIESLTLPSSASELRVKLVNEKYFIRFNLLTNPRIVSGQYFVARKKFISDSINPSEYVDVRVEEKVFFK